MNFFRKLTKRKEDTLRARERQEEETRLSEDRYNAMVEFWEQILGHETSRVASISELEESSLEMIMSAIRGKWFKKLPAKFSRGGTRLGLWADSLHGYENNPLIYIGLSYPEPHSYGRIVLGNYADRVEVLRSRYNLVNNLLMHGQEIVEQYEKEVERLRNQMLESLQRMSHDRS